MQRAVCVGDRFRPRRPHVITRGLKSRSRRGCDAGAPASSGVRNSAGLEVSRNGTDSRRFRGSTSISHLYSVSRPTHITNSTYPSRSVSMPPCILYVCGTTQKYSSPQPTEAEHTCVCTKSAKQASPRPSFCPRLTGRLLTALQKFSTPTPRNPTPRGGQSQGGWRTRSWRSVMLACSEATRARPPPAPSAVASWGVPP